MKKDEDLLIGNKNPIEIITDDTVETHHITISRHHNTCKVIDNTKKFGSFYKIDTDSTHSILYGQYLAIGKTWIIFKYDVVPIICIISKEYSVIFSAKLAEDRPYVIRRNKDLPISIPDDSSVSGRHLCVTPLKDKVEVRDLASTNGTYVKFETMMVSSKEVIRIGVETFLNVEWRDAKDCVKVLVEVPFVNTELLRCRQASPI